MVWKKVMVATVLCLMSFGHLMVLAQSNGAQGLGVSPAIQEVEAEPGKAYDIDYLIENNTGIDNLTVDVTIETFEEGTIQGSANVLPFKPENDISYWLAVPKFQQYKQLEKKKLAYQLTVPQDTAPGAYFFAIVYQPQTSTTQKVSGNTLELKTRIATLLFVNIGGDVSKQPQIENFTVNNQWVDPILDKVDINYDIRVKGNSFYRPVGNVFLSDGSSDSITTLSSFTSDKLILPNAKRNYKSCLVSTILITKQCSESKLDGNLPWFGNKTLTLRLDYNDGTGNPQTVIAEKNLILFPYKTTLIFVGSILLFLLSYKLISNYRRKRYAITEINS